MTSRLCVNPRIDLKGAEDGAKLEARSFHRVNTIASFVAIIFPLSNLQYHLKHLLSIPYEFEKAHR